MVPGDARIDPACSLAQSLRGPLVSRRVLVAFIASLGLEMRRRAEPSGEVRNLGVLGGAGPSKRGFQSGEGRHTQVHTHRGQSSRAPARHSRVRGGGAVAHTGKSYARRMLTPDSKSFNFSGWRCGSLQRSSPMQPDYFNCGIFPLLLSRCLHHNVKISRRWTSEDLDAQRDVITLELMNGRVLTFIG